MRKWLGTLGPFRTLDSFRGCNLMFFFLSLNSFEGKVHQHFLNLKLRSLAQICCQFVVLQLGDSPVSN